MVFGIVKGYTYVKWSSKEGEKEWANYTNNRKRLIVLREPVISELTSQRWIDTMVDAECKPGE